MSEGDAQVVVGEGVIRFEADGFLELADRLVGSAFLAEDAAEVVVSLRRHQVGAPGPCGNVAMASLTCPRSRSKLPSFE